MKRPTVSGSGARRVGRGSGGFVSAYFALVASLVLVPLVMVAIDLANLAFHRAKLKATADAVALAAVSESRTLHIPIPTEFAGWIPVNGYILNGVRLSNVTTLGRPEQKLTTLAKLNQQPGAVELKVEKLSLLPPVNLVTPFLYVKVPVTADVKVITPGMARLLGGKKQAVKLKAQACAMVWYRVDQWVQPWWSKHNPDAVVDTVNLLVDVKGEPLKYYRLINCVDDLADAVSLAEAIALEHFNLMKGTQHRSTWEAQEKRTNPKDGEAMDERSYKDARSGKGTTPDARSEMKRAEGWLGREEAPCRKGDPCIESTGGADWVEASKERKKAEEEALKRAAAAETKQAAQQAAQQAAASQTSKPGR